MMGLIQGLGMRMRAPLGAYVLCFWVQQKGIQYFRLTGLPTQ